MNRVRFESNIKILDGAYFQDSQWLLSSSVVRGLQVWIVPPLSVGIQRWCRRCHSQSKSKLWRRSWTSLSANGMSISRFVFAPHPLTGKRRVDIFLESWFLFVSRDLKNKFNSLHCSLELSTFSFLKKRKFPISYHASSLFFGSFFNFNFIIIIIYFLLAIVV